MRDVAVRIISYVVAVSLFVWWGGFRGYDRSPELVLATLGGTLAIAMVAQGVSHSRRASREVLTALSVGLPLALLAWNVGVSSMFEGATRWWPSKPGLRCFRLSMVDGGIVLIASLLTLRGTEPAHPRLSGAAMGSAAGAVAWLLVDLWCPVGHPAHVLLGHVLPMVLLTAVGALAGGLVSGGAR